MKILTKDESAKILRISSRTLDRLRVLGQIRAIKIAGVIRFTEDEIQKFIERSKEK